MVKKEEASFLVRRRIMAEKSEGEPGPKRKSMPLIGGGKRRILEWLLYSLEDEENDGQRFFNISVPRRKKKRRRRKSPEKRDIYI